MSTSQTQQSAASNCKFPLSLSQIFSFTQAQELTSLCREHEEQPRAYVVLQEEARGKLSDKDIHAWIGERVAKHKQLTGGIEFIDEVPKSPSGKILRKVLKEWAARDAKELKKPRAKL